MQYNSELMDNDRTLRFDGCMATNLEETFHHLEQVYNRLIDPLGLSILEWYVLRALYTHDGMSASQLAQTVCRHPSSMTALLDRMEAKGLLRREMDSEDRRSVRLYLTACGQTYRPQVEIVVNRLHDILDSLITPDQLETFLYVLGVLQNVPLPERL